MMYADTRLSTMIVLRRTVLLDLNPAGTTPANFARYGDNASWYLLREGFSTKLAKCLVSPHVDAISG